MKYWDISPLVHSGTAVFPGDKNFSRSVAVNFDHGNNFLLSSIDTTLHIGAHADATNHYSKSGEGIETRDLNYYFGACQVIHVKIPRGARIFPKDIAHEKIQAPRVLFRTDSFPNPDQWNGDFNSLSPELITELVAKGVKLVGIDTPSVDPSDSKPLESHHAIFQNKLAILEGLTLSQVNAGIYTLVALPLRIKNADASPVRAILLDKDIIRN